MELILCADKSCCTCFSLFSWSLALPLAGLLSLGFLLSPYCFKVFFSSLVGRTLETFWMATSADNDQTSKSKVYRNTGGPHGLGDPEDKTLRKVERDVLIKKKMREISRVEKCPKEVEDFTKCCKASKLGMLYKCKTENAALWNCLEIWFRDEEFKERCTKEYLAERSEYRRTGLTMKERKLLQTEGD